MANALANSRYMLSLNGSRLLSLAITKINRQQPISSSATFRVHMDDWRKIFGGNRTTAYENLQAAAKNLQEAHITLNRHPNGESGAPSGGTTKLVEQCHYEPLAAHVEIVWSQKISSYLSDLKCNFLKHDVRDISLMTSAYAVRLYQLCLANQPRNSASYTLDELLWLLRLETCPSYRASWRLRQRVIDPAIAQINAHTPLKLTSTPIYEGRRIIGIKLNWVVSNKASEASRLRTMTKSERRDTEIEAPKSQHESSTTTRALKATPSRSPSIRTNETRPGTRLPEDWTLPESWLQWAREYFEAKKQPLTDAEILECGDNFADHWHSKPGEGGLKTDWEAAWRVWIRNARTLIPPRKRGANRIKPSGMDVVHQRMRYEDEGGPTTMERALAFQRARGSNI
ncbi:replication initiation protein [Guyparkeria hydrothermalis]|uniref:RepB family plasmid replication initiator protein n=1 Tax=Guyparkeria TaxID=2035712 RepID=UPI00145E8846|nr:replication initiation protein [Guyparkeria hydrothermalis]